jgi:hypothetical protein
MWWTKELNREFEGEGGYRATKSMVMVSVSEGVKWF